MVELKYIGTHQPAGMIIDAQEEDVKKLLDSGEYDYLDIKKKIIIPNKEVLDDNSKRFDSKI